MSAPMVEFEPDEPQAAMLRRMTISQAVDDWLGELERKNHSTRTVDTYRRLLYKLADDYPRTDIDELTAPMIRRFLDVQAKKKNGQRKSASSIAQSVTILNGFLDWLTFEGMIARNPARRNGQRILSRPKQVSPDENDNVTTVSTDDVRLLMHAAELPDAHQWSRRLAIHALACLGPRRHALSNARIGDYDPVERFLSFREKGGKTIAKPVPDVLATIIDAAIREGVYERQWNERQEDYLIPGRKAQRRPGDRDDRVIWHLVKDVAEDAKVTAHVHALRAAFAVHYLETHPDQNSILALRDLMGHKRIETTLVYLRRLKRRQGMETVRDLDYGWAGHQTIGIESEGCVLLRPEMIEPASYVYFISSSDLSKRAATVKIGYAIDPQQRLENLQTGSPAALKIAAVIPDGTMDDEAELHYRFRRSRLQGEWFRVTDEIRAVVAERGYTWPLDSSAFCEEPLYANAVTEKEGFEPSIGANRGPMRPGIEPTPLAPTKEAP